MNLPIMSSISNYYKDNGEALVAAKEGEKTNVAQSETYTSSESFQTEDYTTQEEEFSEGGVNPVHDGPMVDVDEFDKLVGDALDSIEVVTEKKDVSSKEEEEPVVKLVNGILIRAIKSGASDIHIEPYERSLRVRYRVDGIMFNAMNLPKKIKDSVTSRLKIMAKLDIAERRLPQDGRIKLRLGKNETQTHHHFTFLFVISLPLLAADKNSPSANPLLGEFNEIIQFADLTADNIKEATDVSIKEARGALAELYTIPKEKRTLDNTMLELDNIYNKAGKVYGCVYLMNSTHPDDAARNMAQECNAEFAKFFNEISLDENLYRAVKDYSETEEAKSLTGYEARFVQKTVEDFDRQEP